MAIVRSSTWALVSLCLYSSMAIQIWTAPGALPSVIPASCRAALSTNITCSSLIGSNQVANQVNLEKSFLQQYCTATCQKSLLAYQAAVHTRCGDTVYAFSNLTSQSGNAVADPLVWAYNVSCIVDTKTSGFCLPSILSGSVGACDDCFLKYAAGLLGSTYGRTRIDPPTFSSLLSSCSIAPTKYPYSTISSSITTTSVAAPLPSCTGKLYTVTAGDTCKSIAAANSLALDRFISENSIDYNCNSLVAGRTVCIGDSCSLHTIVANETCTKIVEGRDYTIVELQSWNPTIHKNCDNLDTMIGRSICNSPPGTSKYVVTTGGGIGTTSSNSTSYISITSWAPGPSVGTIPTNFTTSYNGATFPPVPTSTLSYNSTGVFIFGKATQYCPVTDLDLENGFDWDDLTQTCLDLIMPYCQGDPTATTLTSRRFPASCSPSFYLTATPTTPAVATVAMRREGMDERSSVRTGDAPTPDLIHPTIIL